MSEESLYRDHLAQLDRVLADALERAARSGSSFDGVLFHAGRERLYHADDQPYPFRQTPHFVRWVPLAGPEHCVLARPGRPPMVVRVAPQDFWYETTPLESSYWQDAVDLHEVSSFEKVRDLIGAPSRLAYVGNAPDGAAALGFDDASIEPQALLAPLDWHRATKTAFEISRLTRAAERGADGHRVARKAFESGASEREIHWAYLEATGHLECELPFEAITARGEKIAILHYQNKRATTEGQAVFMLDAGAQCDGYASDITRTWVGSDPDPLYATILESVDALQRDLVGMVTPGRPFPELHAETHRRVALLLVETGIFDGSAGEALDAGVTRRFFPHGLGHHLGIQVHDVGGHQAAPEGGVKAPPASDPALRNTRTLEPGHVVTIEPGVYFAPVLLEQLRADPAAANIDWTLVDALRPWGGVRIEDDVVCTEEGPKDLTRPLIQGPRGI